MKSKAYAQLQTDNARALQTLNPTIGDKWPIKTAAGIIGIASIERETPDGPELSLSYFNVKTDQLFQEVRPTWATSWSGLLRAIRRIQPDYKRGASIE